METKQDIELLKISAVLTLARCTLEISHADRSDGEKEALIERFFIRNYALAEERLHGLSQV